MPIRIRRQDKNGMEAQFIDSQMFMIETLSFSLVSYAAKIAAIVFLCGPV